MTFFTSNYFKKALYLFLALFLIACNQVQYKSAQPKDVASISEFPKEFIGSFWKSSDHKFVIIKKNNFKYVNLVDPTYNRTGTLGENAVLKKHNGTYWLSLKIKGETGLWNAGYFELSDDKLTTYLIGTEVGLGIVKKHTKYTSKSDGDVLVINPSPEELEKIKADGAFKTITVFTKESSGDKEEFFRKKHREDQEKKDAALAETRASFCSKLDSLLNLNSEDWEAAIGTKFKFMNRYSTSYYKYSKSLYINMKETSLRLTKAFDATTLKAKMKECGAELEKEHKLSTGTVDYYYRLKRKSIRLSHSSYGLSLNISYDSKKERDCIKGDCLNGYGEVKYNNGTYKGNFSNGLKSGEGTYEFNSGAKYVGEWKTDKKHGKGTYYREDGTIFYKGDWAYGQKEGSGIKYFKDNWKYEGNFKYGKEAGYGKLTDDLGKLRYEGNWKSGKKDGFGTYSYTNGDVYTGSWKNGKRDGQGKVTAKDGKLLFEGSYENGNPVKEKGGEENTCLSGDCTNGYGKLKHFNGVLYEGFFENGKAHGPGFFTYLNGNKAYADFENGSLNGFGVYYWKENNEYYIGEWKYFKQNGLGLYLRDLKYLSSGVLIDNKYSLQYDCKTTEKTTGCLAGDCSSTVGEYKWDNGVKFLGFWKDNKPTKHGMFKYKDGGFYMGQVNGTTKEGFAFNKWSHGGFYIGYYKNNQLNGKGLYINPNDASKTLIGIFENGKLTKKLR